ncbi:MAG: FkbM family methyltransferase [Pseudomonadota bacterium]
MKAQFFAPPGAEFHMYDPDDSTDRETVPGNDYEPAVTQLLQSFYASQNGGVFLDVGALYGYFALYVARLSPTTRVIAFEPNQRSAAILQENVRLNGVNVEVRTEALSDRSTTHAFKGKTLTSGEAAETSSTGLSPDDFERAAPELETRQRRVDWLGWASRSVRHIVRSAKGWDAAETVQCARFDDLFDQPLPGPVFMKVDIHGAEVLALRGMQKFLKQNLDVMFLELHRDDMLVGGDHGETVELLQAADLEIFDIRNFRSDEKWSLDLMAPSDLERLKSSKTWSFVDRTAMKMLLVKRKGFDNVIIRKAA